MTRKIRKLRRQFNIFGLRFQRWLGRMMPAFMPVGLIPHIPGACPQVEFLSAPQREELARLVRVWTEMHRHEMV